MRSLVFFLAVSAFFVAGTWGMILWRSGDPPPADRHLGDAFPDRGTRERLRAGAEPIAIRVEGFGKGYFGRPGPRVRKPLEIAACHALFVWSAVLVFLPALAGAVALGLFRREAARTLVKFSSPTAAFAAKKLFLAALLGLGVFALTPVAVPYWIAYAALGVMTATLAVYVENIPVKI